MIFGECPYDDCNAAVTVEVPEGAALPVMAECECPTCHRTFWEYMSRVSPMAYREDQVVVNEVTKSVKIKE